MNPQDKAKEIISKFDDVDSCYEHYNDQDAPCSHQVKQCAIICVEQIIPCTWKLATYKKNGYILVDEQTTTEYWEEVLQILKNS